MPANLPPEYFAADAKFRQASTPAEKIAALEVLISTVPKHKGTDKLRADLRRKLSQLRKEALTRKKSGGRGDLYAVQREGAAQIALAGFANAGKSSLLASLTHATPLIADYPISTVAPLPGMMPFEDIQIQLVDLPPVGNEPTDGWVSGLLRNADALLLLVDLTDDAGVQAELLIELLERWKIGIASSGTREDTRVIKKALLAANKNDSAGAAENFFRLKEKYGHLCPCLSLSVKKKDNLEELKRILFEVSGVIRIYSKRPGKEADFSNPFTIASGSTLLDLARVIHKDFVANLKFARIWGSAKFDGQRVEKNYVLRDRDIVEFHI